MWVFQRDDTLDEDEDGCEFVLAGEGGAGAKYLVMRGEGAETGAEVARGGAGLGGGGVEHVRIVSARLGGEGSGLGWLAVLRFSDRGRTGLGGWRACFRALVCAAGDGGRVRFGGLCATLCGRGGGVVGGGGRCRAVCDVL